MIINNKTIDDTSPAYIVAEIGANHNGDINLAIELINLAVDCGANAVKFQKRKPEECIPYQRMNEIKDTPWGKMSYLEYRNKLEFNYKEYEIINSYCKEKNIDWFVSCWDYSSIDFIEKFHPVAIKIPSTKMKDLNFLKRAKGVGCPLILSSGGCDFDDIDRAINCVGVKNNALLQCTSIYPSSIRQLNLSVISEFVKKYKIISGFSCHHTNPIFGAFSLAYGGKIIEYHFTKSRDMWGSDQKISLEPRDFKILIDYVNLFEDSKGDGTKTVYELERTFLSRLSKYNLKN